MCGERCELHAHRTVYNVHRHIHKMQIAPNRLRPVDFRFSQMQIFPFPKEYTHTHARTDDSLKCKQTKLLEIDSYVCIVGVWLGSFAVAKRLIKCMLRERNKGFGKCGFSNFTTKLFESISIHKGIFTVHNHQASHSGGALTPVSSEIRVVPRVKKTK